VIGNAGGGKSRLSRSICDHTHLPLYEIDKFQWRPGWVPTPRDVFDEQHHKIILCDRWLLDGFGPWSTVVERLSAADTIIFVDLPIWRHFWWATKRQIKSLFVGRPDGPEGCPLLPVTLKIYKMIWAVHTDLRPKLLDTLGRMEEQKTVIRLTSLRELNQFSDYFKE